MSTPKVLILRPEPGASVSLGAARAAGLDAEAHPLFAVTPTPWEAPARENIDALLLGSANALRHAGTALEAFCGLSAYAVGEKTAQAAREAGLDVVMTGHGGLQVVLDAITPGPPGTLRLLRLAGRERVTLNPPAGVSITTREVYASEPVPAPERLRTALGQPCVVLLHSGEAAVRFEHLCAHWEIARSTIHLAAIGPRVSGKLGSGWASVEAAPVPSDAALLALAARMCQEVGSGSMKADNQT